MYAVKDDTKTKLQICGSYFPSDGGAFIRGLSPAKWDHWPLVWQS